MDAMRWTKRSAFLTVSGVYCTALGFRDHEDTGFTLPPSTRARYQYDFGRETRNGLSVCLSLSLV